MSWGSRLIILATKIIVAAFYAGDHKSDNRKDELSNSNRYLGVDYQQFIDSTDICCQCGVNSGLLHSPDEWSSSSPPPVNATTNNDHGRPRKLERLGGDITCDKLWPPHVKRNKEEIRVENKAYVLVSTTHNSYNLECMIPAVITIQRRLEL